LKLHKIIESAELRPHKVRYYVERRDPAFESKMAIVLKVYKEIEIVNDGLVRGELRDGDPRKLGLVTLSHNEKPGIQALAVTAPDRPPVPGKHPSHLRDHEYVRLGTVSLLAGLDLHTGDAIEIISNTHKSSDFIAFLKKVDEVYPAALGPAAPVLDFFTASYASGSDWFADWTARNAFIRLWRVLPIPAGTASVWRGAFWR